MAIAELLRSARERRGLTLDRLAEETKIPRGRLATFEQQGFRPDGGFYQRAQIRACARALSLDETLVLEELRQDASPAVPIVSPKAEPRLRRSRRSSVLMTAGCVVAVAFAAAAQLNRESAAVLHPTESAAMPASSDPVDSPVNRADDTRRVEIGELASRATVGTTEPDEAPAPAAVPEVTTLLITSQPEGARVTVDGVGWGVTPLTIRHLPEGVKRIRVTSDGYVAAERVVQVRPEGATNVAVELRRASTVDPEP